MMYKSKHGVVCSSKVRHLLVEAGAESGITKLLECFVQTNRQSSAKKLHAVTLLRWVVHRRVHFLNLVPSNLKNRFEDKSSR
jgi:hypothetical protein